MGFNSGVKGLITYRLQECLEKTQPRQQPTTTHVNETRSCNYS